MNRRKWDAKHQARGVPGRPSPFLVEHSHYLPRGRCLDLAAGGGANSVFMAEQDFAVEAWDWSFQGLRTARALASRNKVRINALVVDLMSYPFPVGRYDVILCFRFLARELWSGMTRALRPGGALVMETYTMEHLKSRPEFPRQYCLETGELLEAFSDMQVAVYREIPGEPLASILAFKKERYSMM